MELMTKRKTKKLATGGGGGNVYYDNLEILESYKNLVLAKHPDNLCGIYKVQAADSNYLEPSRISFGETPRTSDQPSQEIKVTNEAAARAKWESIVNDLGLKDAEAEQKRLSMEAVKKQRETAAQIRDMKIKKVTSRRLEAIDSLKAHIQKPGIDLFAKKTTDLVDQVQRCETLLKFL